MEQALLAAAAEGDDEAVHTIQRLVWGLQQFTDQLVRQRQVGLQLGTVHHFYQFHIEVPSSYLISWFHSRAGPIRCYLKRLYISWPYHPFEFSNVFKEHLKGPARE